MNSTRTPAQKDGLHVIAEDRWGSCLGDCEEPSRQAAHADEHLLGGGLAQLKWARESLVERVLQLLIHRALQLSPAAAEQPEPRVPVEEAEDDELDDEEEDIAVGACQSEELDDAFGQAAFDVVRIEPHVPVGEELVSEGRPRPQQAALLQATGPVDQ